MKNAKRPGKYTRVDLVIAAVLILWALIQLFPVYNALAISFVSEATYARSSIMLFPPEISLDAYKFVFNSEAIWNGYRVTALVLLLGLTVNMFLTCTTAFALSRKKFIGKNFVFNLIIVTMYFTGGLIPLYILLKNFHLVNSIFSMVLPVGLNTFNMLIVRNYFLSIPEAMEESAYIDGANLFVIFWNIILPLSAPVLATIGLFYAVDRWNEWFFGMLFIQEPSKQPLQLVLRNIILDISRVTTAYAAANQVTQPSFALGVKMASVFIVMTPIAIVYPFLQRFFIKGIMIGAIKG